MLVVQGVLEKEELLETLQVEQQRVKQEIVKVYRLYQDGQLDSEAFGRFYRPLEERSKQIEGEIPRLQSEIDISKVSTMSTSEIAAAANNLSDQWPDLDEEAKRAIIDQITERIQVGKDRIIVRLYYSPPCKDVVNRWRKGRDLNPR